MPETLGQIVVGNLIFIVFISIAITLFTEYDRAFAFFASLWTALCLSIFGWTVFVIVHFVSKYW